MVDGRLRGGRDLEGQIWKFGLWDQFIAVTEQWAEQPAASGSQRGEAEAD
jgi:hypothetical protein